jgi:hypothetical protein
MDARRFDALTRTLTTALTRRQGIRAAVVAVAGGALAVDQANATIRRRTCRPAAAACLRNSDCCSGACETRRTAPRNRRNRCICIPDCTGKICGSDGCGGMCGPDGTYGCLSGETCNDAGDACETGCTDYAGTNPDSWCTASTEGVTYEAYGYWYFSDATCDTAADCPTYAMCDVAGYECYCQRAYHFGGEYGKYDTDQGACQTIRTEPSYCVANAGNYPSGFSKCSENIDGTSTLHYGWKQDWAGVDATCLNDAECIALDPTLCNDTTNISCGCDIGGWYQGIDDTYWDRGFCAARFLDE